MKNTLTILASLLVAPLAALHAAELFVATSGSDVNPGTEQRPLRTVQSAVDRMKAGDNCMLRGGTYREQVTVKTSGEPGRPVRLQAYPGETVIFDGTETVSGKWNCYKGSIFQIAQRKGIEQLFVGREMMIEARWPNMRRDQVFDRSCWAKTEMGSEHGRVICEELAKTGIDWTGAMACLNVAHQWWTWNRPVVAHKAGTNTLQYPADLVGLCGYDPRITERPAWETPQWLAKGWADDYFYLFGKLEALDVETEWFQDQATGVLYLFAPGGVDPSTLEVRYKVRDYAVRAQGRHHLEIKGINFFATAFRLEDCNDCVIEGCELLYPSYSRTITEYDQTRRESVFTKVTGDRNTVRRCSLAHTNNLGLMVLGNGNVVENCIIHDVNWSGTLIYPALQLSASPHLGVNWFDTIQYPPTERTTANSDVTSYGNAARRNTLFNGGSSLLVYQAADSVIEYNHVYDGGKACKDVSLIYGCWPFSRGSVVRYNWVHGCFTEGYGGRGGAGGIGIRADDQSRNNVFHHNVVWDCGQVGIIMKGEDHRAFNNTVFAIGTPNKPQIDLLLPAEAEPVKIWAVQWPQLLMQNQWTEGNCSGRKNLNLVECERSVAV
jgi:Right handed beta helix region